jgi:hypothetical protein
MVFRNDNHGVLFEKEIRYHKGCSRKMTAALFLLTADSRLWHQAENHIGTNEIDITAIKPRRLDAMAYVCFTVAKDIITGSRTVSLTELADPSMLPPRYFLVIQTAMLIRGYGLSAANRLLFTEGRDQNELRQK